MFEFKKIKVLGYTTDFNKCECCGKENLKGTVSIRCLLTDVVLHFGVVCAANANKYDSLDAAKEAKKEITKVVNEHNEIIKACRGFAHRSEVCKEIRKRKNLYIILNYNPHNKPTHCMEDLEYKEAYNVEFERILKMNIEMRQRWKEEKEKNKAPE